MGIEVADAAASPIPLGTEVADEPALASAGTAVARPPSARARTAPPTLVRLRRLLNEAFNCGSFLGLQGVRAHTSVLPEI
jgi:hypothetical protein